MDHLRTECKFDPKLKYNTLQTLLYSWNMHACMLRHFNPIQKAMAPHSSTLAWKIPWTEEPGGLQSMGSLRVWVGWLAGHFQPTSPIHSITVTACLLLAGVYYLLQMHRAEIRLSAAGVCLLNQTHCSLLSDIRATFLSQKSEGLLFCIHIPFISHYFRNAYEI